MAQAILELMNFLKDFFMAGPKFLNFVIVGLVNLVLGVWPSSSSLGIPMPSALLDQAHAGFPMFPWSVVADLFGVGLALLGGVLTWKAIALIWI